MKTLMENSLVKNSIYNIFYKIVSVLYPLIAVTYVSHILMSERLGMVSYAQNIVSYFVIASALGIPTYGIREIAVRYDDKIARSQTFWELFVINAISTTCALAAYMALVLSIGRFRNSLLLYSIAGLQIAFNYLNVDWFYQGLEEYKYISIRSIIVKITSIVLLLLMVRTPDDYINYALIYCLAIGGNNVFNILRIRRYISKPTSRLGIRQHMKPIAILLLVSIAVEIYVMIDTTMLGIFCDDSTVGCYSNAMKLTRTVTTTASAIGAVLFPRLSKVYRDDDKTYYNELVETGIKTMLLFAFPAALGMVLLREDIIYVFFGESFTAAIPILKILAMMVPVVVCNTLLGGQVLITTGREKQYMISVVSASIVNVILNSIFIPRFGAPSAAVASLISEAIVLIMYMIFSKGYISLKLNMHYFITIAIPLLVYASVSLLLIDRMQLGRILNITVNVLACVLIYFGLGILLKNEAMLFALEKGKKLLKRRK